MTAASGKFGSITAAVGLTTAAAGNGDGEDGPGDQVFARLRLRGVSAVGDGGL